MTKYVYLAICILFACEVKDPEPEVKKGKWSVEHSIDFNQELHEREELAIKIYLEHHKDLEMIETGTGVRYQFAENRSGTGDNAKFGDQVSVNLSIALLDGTSCYETDSIPDQFVLGRSDAESGLQEVLQLMSTGQKTKIIIPSYLAHGLLGDSEIIPPQSILIIDVELISLQ
jgi:FKBP-type peptidyl-prolyl cis-trans isomerase